jgi:quercetin dioxygenase-like cupin family protein
VRKKLGNEDEEQISESCQPPAKGGRYAPFGDEIVIHLDGQDTDGMLTMWTGMLPPGGGPPPHYHLNEDEAFRVLEGQVAFLVNGE